MRIVLVNWAKIWDGAPVGGGVNGYCQSLALECLERGHDVTYVCSGTQCTPDPSAPGPDLRPGPCMVRRHPDWLGTRVFEIVNSPVLAPAGYQFRAPAAEVTSPALEARFAELFVLLRPDVVHFHNIEGLTAGCVAAVRAAAPRAPVLFSLHNYHTVCPQVYLMQRHLYPCHDNHGGQDCETCIDATDPDEERLRRVREWADAVKFTPLTVAAPELAAADSEPRQPPPLRGALAALFRDRSRTERSPPAASLLVASVPPPLSLPGYPADSPDRVSVSSPYPGTDPRGQTAAILGDLSPPRPAGPGDREWEPLANHILPRTTHDGEPNGYALRERAMIAMLNACDRVLAVSKFVSAKFESLGVNPARLRTLPIGTRAGRVAARYPELLFDPPPFDAASPRPIRMVFMGYNNIYKGLPMLADTLELLTPEVLSRFHLHIYAQSLQSIEWRFRRLEPRLGGLTVGYGYQYYDIPWICGGKDLGVVTSVWWDNAPQTVFEFQSCGLPVLGANVGGIPDFVEDGVNGLLFRANDRYDLARRLAALARDPSILSTLRRNVRPPKDIADHARELEDVYSGCLKDRQSSPTSSPMVAYTPSGVTI